MIIVEVNSKKACCRKNVRPLNEDMLESFLDSNIGKSIKTYIQGKVAEVLISYLFGEPSQAVRDSLIYKTIIQAIAQVDLKELIGIAKHEREACETIATGIIVAIIPVITSEISTEAQAFAKEAGENLSGGPNPIFDTITQSMKGSAELLVRIATEKIKEMDEMQAFADALCKIEWMDMLKKEFANIPGVGFIMDKIFE